MLQVVLALAVAAAAVPLEAADAPRAGEGPPAEARAAVAAGRYAEAAAKLARSSGPEAAFLRAVALVRADREAEALAPLRDLEQRLPDVADRIAFLRAQALEAAGRPRAAAAALATVDDDSVVAADARLARARIAAGLGDRAAALDALAPLVARGAPAETWRPDPAATALLAAGRLHASGGDGEQARRAYLACWASHPLAPEADDCRTALAALKAPWAAPPDHDDVLRRAEALLDANRTDAALALVVPLLDGLPEAGPRESFACRARAAAGRALRKERSYARAIDLLGPVAARCDDAEVRARALYLLAGATAGAGDKDGAVSIYRQLAREFPTHRLADDALFLAADLLASAGHPAQAGEALAAIVRDHPGSDRRDEARFRLAWLAKQTGDVDGAISRLLAIEEDDAVDAYEHARAAYWRARLMEGRGEEGRRAARAIWADLAQRHPADYYGLMSRARIAPAAAPGEPGGVAAAAQPSPASPAAAAEDGAGAGTSSAFPPQDVGSLRDDRHFRAALLLLRLGLSHEAADELAAVDPAKLGGSSPDAPEGALVVADLLDRAGDHRAAHNLLRTRARAALRRPPSGDNLRVWRIAYPPAYRDDVLRWAPPAGVPADLVQALMREESALDPRAISPVGAIGLTQLMLPTARSVARELRMGRITRADLTRASVNIRIGARYLGELIRRFDGSVALALAAYNAGAGAVSRWREQRPGLALDEFVEEIPYEETRGYVKRVLRSFAAYQLLYGPPGASAPTALLGTTTKS